MLLQTKMVFLMSARLLTLFQLCWASDAGSKQTYHQKSRNSSPLTGRHLIFSGLDAGIDFHTRRNASGHVLGFAGVAVDMLSSLSSYYNFSYSIHHFGSITFLDAVGADQPGLIDLVNRGECDIVATVTPTGSRAQLVDFTHPSIYIPVTFAIPVPRTSANLLAVVQPFAAEVWIGVVLSYLAVYSSLYAFIWHFRERERRRTIWSYVYMTALKHADGFRLSKRLPVQMVIFFWCLAIFVLFTGYTTLLTSFVTAPKSHPLIRSIEEVLHRPDILLVTDKGRNVAALLLSAESGIFKELGDKLRAGNLNESLCTKCIDVIVKSGRGVVYIGGKEGALIPALAEDFEQSGKCNAEVSRQVLSQLRLNWAIRKANPYKSYLDSGFMRMREAGLIELWYKRNTPDVHQCLREQPKGKEKLEDGSPLPLKGFGGAFILLFAGCTASLMILICEIIAAPRLC